MPRTHALPSQTLARWSAPLPDLAGVSEPNWAGPQLEVRISSSVTTRRSSTALTDEQAGEGGVAGLGQGQGGRGRGLGPDGVQEGGQGQPGVGRVTGVKRQAGPGAVAEGRHAGTEVQAAVGPDHLAG